MATSGDPAPISIAPLLRRLSSSPDTLPASEITTTIDHIFSNRLSPVQASALLTALHFTKLDEKPEIIAAAAESMRKAGVVIPGLEARFGVQGHERQARGRYKGGLVDIVGTGGDGHDTFNVSTTSAVLAAACGLQVCKHGNKASTSSSGSADILTALGADLWSVTPDKVSAMFTQHKPAAEVHTADERKQHQVPAGTFCFLLAPLYHPSMRHISPVRTQLPFRTIFNLLGPLVNPIDYSLPPDSGLETRIIGVNNMRFGRIFADTLILLGVRTGMVVSGAENLDEISPEGNTFIWKLRPHAPLKPDQKPGVIVEEFKVHPTKTFGLPTHPLSRVSGGKKPEVNAEILKRIVRGEVDPEEDSDERAILDFVILNTAALVVATGVVGSEEEEEESVDEEGVAIGGKWKEAVEVVKEAIASGRGWTAWEEFVKWSKK
ncbi:glycosyl transferase [Kalaharituber pfeilii]|nr:glycosyl transferase [Kalaharituber pfeilii]